MLVKKKFTSFFIVLIEGDFSGPLVLLILSFCWHSCTTEVKDNLHL